MKYKNSIVLVLAVATLVCIGLVMLTSTSVWIESESAKYSHLTKQTVFLCIGVILAYILAKLDYTLLKKKKWIIYLGFIISTLL